MLRWSSDAQGDEVDLTSIGSGHGLVGARADVLWRFASACADDALDLDAARAELVAATDEALMVDAAAVAANFEMMTRLADSTGARMPGTDDPARADQFEQLGVAEFTSRR